MYYIYIIKSAEERIYTGHTNDRDRRLFEHNFGMCKSTKNGTDWKLAYSEEYRTHGEAMKRERWLKTGVGREFVKKILCGMESASAE